MHKSIKSLQKEISKYKFTYLLLSIIIAIGFFIRVYRVDQILGFYFDQGRDALVIWDFLHKGKFFLVGPTTGIAGIFRGPFYYYLITPFYWLGQGNPVYPAVFLAILSMLAVVLIYYLGKEFHSRTAGIFAAAIASFSFYIMLASRWLSNPTPMLFLSLLLVWAMYLVTKGKKWAWAAVALLSGASLFHFGSSGEFFYFPAILVLYLWQSKNRPNIKIFFVSVALFFATALPLILFDIRHDWILSNNIKAFIFGGDTFKSSFWDVLQSRINFYYDVFTSKIFHWIRTREVILLSITGLSFLAFLPRFLTNKGIKILMLLLLSPIIGLLFFQGNYGNIYDYYMTGYYLIFILLFAIVLAELFKYKIGKLFVAFFFFAFIQINSDVVSYKISADPNFGNTIVLGTQKSALDWIYKDANGNDFNVDVYVPPVIPYAYDYLFRWYSSVDGLNKGSYLVSNQVSILYTLYEVDPPHPERLDEWLDRQNGIGEVEKQQTFGGITVQRRKRI